MLRKTYNGQGFRAGVARASMRPQRNAAENEVSAGVMAEAVQASMRPQRNAAENHPILA